MCGVAERWLPRFDQHAGDPQKLDDMRLLPSIAQPNRRECAMKLNSAQVGQTLGQFEAQVIPDDHPMVPKLNELFGDHTFFLNGDGLNVVEPNEGATVGAREGTVVSLASWTDARMTGLAPHEPEPTETIVILETEH
jgi:hypothetical protein